MRIEVAGGGIAGLTFATVAARGGHNVTLWEQAAEIREVGAGLYVKNNALHVLGYLGILDEITAAGLQILERRTCDGQGRIIQTHPLTGTARVWMAPRNVLVQALLRAALAADVTVKLNETVRGADPRGALLLDSGVAEADLVVGADGRGSPVRDSLGLTVVHKNLTTMATRYLVESRLPTPEPVTTEYWDGSRRIGVVPCTETSTYSYVICAGSDVEGCRQPLDVDSWSRSFPVLRPALELFARSAGVQHAYPIVRVSSWRSGRAVLVGDSATALPPTLGQGAGLAMVNAAGLASRLTTIDELDSCLAGWERDFRPNSDRTQNWAVRYDSITNRWPTALRKLREPAIWSMNHIPMISGRMRAADSFVPSFERNSR